MSGFFLIDTNVLSEFGRRALPPHPKVKQWVESVQPNALFASVFSFGEIRTGIELLPLGKKRVELERWLDVDLNRWSGHNLLPVTRAISDRWEYFRLNRGGVESRWVISTVFWRQLALNMALRWLPAIQNILKVCR